MAGVEECRMSAVLMSFAFVLATLAAPCADNGVSGRSAAGAFQETVRVSKDFGFDPVDSTRFVQAAFRSGAKRVVIDRQASDWIVTSLTGAPNQTVELESGVVLRAKPGSFHGRADCLLNYIGCSNVTVTGYGAALEMERAVYDKAPYVKSEHRHTLNIRGGGNITVKGLTCRESGGDGIFIGGGRRVGGVFYPPSGITLKDVKCVRNYRQGMSVIAVRGLLCENCDFSETGGTPPQSGIDFEPNWSDETLQDIVLKNCRFENNKGRGFEFYLGNLNSKSQPVTARFENCVTRGNVNGFEYQQRRMRHNDLPVGGLIELIGCTFEGATHAGISILDKPAYSAKITFRNCKVINCCTSSTNRPDVRMSTRLWDTPPVGGVDFGDIEIRQPVAREKFSPKGTDWTAPGATASRLGAFDFSKAEVTDMSPGKKYAPSAAAFSGEFDLVFYAERARKVSLRAQAVKMGGRALTPIPFRVFRDGKRLRVFPPKAGSDPVDVTFRVPAAGFYTLRIAAGRNALRILEADVPLALDVTDRPRPVAVRNASLYFRTERGARFALFAGADWYEKAALSLADTEGNTVWNCDPVAKWERFQPAAADVKAGIWRIDLKRPKGMHRFVMLDVPGTSGFLFLSPEKFWR